MKAKLCVVPALLLAAGHAAPGVSAPASAPAAAPVAAAQVPAQAAAHPALWPAAHSPAALTSPQGEAFITALLARMTLEQKVGQLIQADIGSITPADLERYPLGSILAGGNSGPGGNERASAADWQRLVSEFRAVSARPAANGVAIPIIFGIDAVHGHNNVPGATIFPHNIALGAAHDPALIQRIGAATAAEIAGSGIDWTFAPTLAVPQDLRWGRSYEGYSADPAEVAAYGRAMVLGLQGPLQAGRPLAAGHVAATAKHFLADGGTSGGVDQGDAAIDEATMARIHARGYPAAIDAGALTVMASFSSWNGTKNHGNPTLLTGVLKQRMGFAGFVVGDWNGHGQVEGCSVTSCPQAINAGLDMFMAPDSWKGLYENTLRQARSGAIPAARLDDAVRRILRVKLKLGALGPVRVARGDLAQIGASAHLALAREAVARSLVLLKNNGAVLPIRPGARVLVAGPGADDMAMQAGGWTISWQGTDVTHADFPNGRTIWQALADAVGKSGGKAVLSADGSFTARPDVAIVVFGETPYAEFQGDVPTLDYQPANPTDLALLRRLKAQGIPVVAVFLSGRPLFTNPELNAADAFVAAWLPGTQADGLADVLVAQANGRPRRDFTGRLSFPWPGNARSPVRDPLFPAGYGLDYRHPATVPPLSEDPGMDVAGALNLLDFFSAGRTRTPWTMTITDAGGTRTVGSAPAAAPAGALASRAADVLAQEDGRALRWTGAGALSIEGPTGDFAALDQQGYALRLDFRVDQHPLGAVKVGLGGGAVDLTARLAAAAEGQVQSVAVPLRCFAAAGADLRHLRNPLRLETDQPFAMTLTGARLVRAGADAACP